VTVLLEYCDLATALLGSLDPVQTFHFNGERHQVSLPWKKLHAPLPVNYDLSLKRLIGLIKRLRHNPDILHQYDAVIHEQIKRGVVEPVETQVPAHTLVHYLPHHAVLQEDKATAKLRMSKVT